MLAKEVMPRMRFLIRCRNLRAQSFTLQGKRKLLLVGFRVWGNLTTPPLPGGGPGLWNANGRWLYKLVFNATWAGYDKIDMIGHFPIRQHDMQLQLNSAKAFNGAKKVVTQNIGLNHENISPNKCVNNLRTSDPLPRALFDVWTCVLELLHAMTANRVQTIVLRVHETNKPNAACCYASKYSNWNAVNCQGVLREEPLPQHFINPKTPTWNPIIPCTIISSNELLPNTFIIPGTFQVLDLGVQRVDWSSRCSLCSISANSELQERLTMRLCDDGPVKMSGPFHQASVNTQRILNNCVNLILPNHWLARILLQIHSIPLPNVLVGYRVVGYS